MTKTVVLRLLLSASVGLSGQTSRRGRRGGKRFRGFPKLNDEGVKASGRRGGKRFRGFPEGRGTRAAR